MSMEFASAFDILSYVGIKHPSEAEQVWAEMCARAVNDGIMVRLNGAPYPDPVGVSELHSAAIMAGGEMFKRREAPFATTGFSDVEGNAISLSRDYLSSIKPIIDRYSNGPGMA